MAETTALSIYFTSQWVNAVPTQVDSIMGVPIYTNPFLPPGKVWVVGKSVYVNTVDVLIMPIILAEVRLQAQMIVRAGIRKACPWLAI